MSDSLEGGPPCLEVVAAQHQGPLPTVSQALPLPSPQGFSWRSPRMAEVDYASPVLGKREAFEPAFPPSGCKRRRSLEGSILGDETLRPGENKFPKVIPIERQPCLVV